MLIHRKATYYPGHHMSLLLHHARISLQPRAWPTFAPATVLIWPGFFRIAVLYPVGYPTALSSPWHIEYFGP